MDPTAEASLVGDLMEALDRQPRPAGLHNALGLVTTRLAHGPGPLNPLVAERVIAHFRQAVEAGPLHLMAHLNLAEALAGVRQDRQAADQARLALGLLEQMPELGREVLDSGHFPVTYDVFRVEWERAGWAYAGNPRAEEQAKRELLRWRIHFLLANLTGDLIHFHEAVLARPDLPNTRASLGCALARVKRVDEAIPHLKYAVTANPFDWEAARALHQALKESGDNQGCDRLTHARRLLHQAAPNVVAKETWFANVRPQGQELVSIVILCCNQLAFTRLCLDSVLRHTRPPYELILVDNGSTDGTHSYLEEIRCQPGPERVVVIRNEDNRGFPAGCNQGLTQAKGRYVVFLNNDTLVTEAWAEGLIGWALHDWPKVGMVGAVTNYSRPPQQIPVDYIDPKDLDRFAARRAREFARKAARVDRLTGFCLLVRREVLEHIGGFDERYGLGFFDDDDLSLRAKQAGFDLYVALNVFIHHFGSRTFADLGVDCRQQLQDNFARFEAKWGKEQTAGYHLPDANTAVHGPLFASVPEPFRVPATEPEPVRETARARVTLCLIVKNEEANLSACLGSVADLVDEMIVVDTGSTDATKDLAARQGAKVFDFPWCDNFAAARNECLRHASGNWIFWMDADDRLDEDNRAKFRSLLAGLPDENVAYSVKCLCLPDPVTGTATVVDHIRLFRNRPEIRWKYRVHEQILPAVRAVGGQVRFADVVIHHTGYQDQALRRRKLDRDLRLLDLEDQEHPNDPFTLFNLGSIYHELGKAAEALPILRRSLDLSHPADSIVRKLYALIVGCHRTLGFNQEALAACQEGRQIYPEDVELLFLEGNLRRELGDLPGAEACLVRLLQSHQGAHFASIDTGLKGYKARHNLAVVHQQQGKFAEAEAGWRAALEERPDFLPSWLALSEALSHRADWDGLEQLAGRLETNGPQGVLEAPLMRARGRMARQDFAGASDLLQALIDRIPEALPPRILLSHVFLKEGKNELAAERALRSILVRHPRHQEALHNLAVLLKNQGRKLDGIGVDGTTLADMYRLAATRPSDLNEHVPTLSTLAQECRHVTELGTRTGVSTTALLYAEPEWFLSYDVCKWPLIFDLELLTGKTRFAFHQANVLNVQIEETDLLFINTWHVYDQLQKELVLHGPKARRFIVVPGTTSFGEVGETAGHRGLWPAIEEFLALGDFDVKDRFTNNNGLTVLVRHGSFNQAGHPNPSLPSGGEAMPATPNGS